MNEELLRACTLRLKQLSSLRSPPYELPSDSSLDRAVRQIAALIAEECAKIAEFDSSTAGEAIRQAFKAE